MLILKEVPVTNELANGSASKRFLTGKDESIVDVQLGNILCRSDTRTFHNKAREKLRLLRPNLHQWMYTSLHESSLHDVLQFKPVTQIVYSWLWDDLKKISWVDGTL